MLDLNKDNARSEVLLSEERGIDVVLNDSGPSPSYISFPNLETIISAGRCPETLLLSRESIDIGMDQVVEIAKSEIAALENKYVKFSGNKTYLNKLAGLARFSGDLITAQRFYVEAKDIEGDPYFNNEIASVAMAGGDWDGAEKFLLENYLEKDVGVNLRLAYISLRKGEIQNAQDYIERALEVDPSDYSVRVLLGALLLNTGNCEKAIRSFRVALSERPHSSIVYVNLATAHLYLGQIKNAEKALVKALEINPANENAAVFLADLVFHLSSSSRAVEHLETFLSYSPDNVTVLDKLARAYYSSRDFKNSKRILLQLKELREDAPLYNNLALVYWKNGEKQRAFEALKKTDEFYPGDAEKLNPSLLNLFNFLNDSKEYERIVQIFRELIKEKEIDFSDDIAAEIYLTYTIALECLNYDEEASGTVDYFLNNFDTTNALRIEFLIRQIYYRSARVDEPELALKTIKEMLGLLNEGGIGEHHVMTSLNNIMFTYLCLDDLESAREIAKRLNKFFHVDPFCTATLGLLNIKSGNLDRGIALYDESVTLATHRKVKQKIKQRKHIELAKIHLAAGEIKKGKELIEKALKEADWHQHAVKEAKRLIDMF